MTVNNIIVSSGNWFFKVRDILAPFVFILLVLTTRPQWSFGDPRDTSLIIAGVTITLLGQTLRAAVIGYAYVKRGGKKKKVYADTLVTEGFFNHTRNPMYVGNVFVIVGLLIVWGSPLALALGTMFYLYLYWAITLAEERYLRSKFGVDYDAYVARVNRYIPDFRGLGKSLEGMQYDWPRLVRKEYGTTFVWVGTLLLLLSRKAFLARLATNTSLQRAFLAVLVLSAIAWAAARILKKVGTLGRD